MPEYIVCASYKDVSTIDLALEEDIVDAPGVLCFVYARELAGEGTAACCCVY